MTDCDTLIDHEEEERDQIKKNQLLCNVCSVSLKLS